MIHLKNSILFLLKRKNYLIINILGLGIGIASFLILSLYVINDYNYNRFNKNYSSIFRIQEGESFQTKGVLLPKMLEDIPEVINGTRIFNWNSFRLSHGDKAFLENIHHVDTGFFSVFTFHFKEGSPKTGIRKKYDAVISSKLAKKFFGEESAIGKKLQVKFGDTFLTVTGVVEVPENSSVKFDVATSYETGKVLSPVMNDIHDWYNVFSPTFVLLTKDASVAQVNNKLQQIADQNFYPVGKNNKKVRLADLKYFHDTYESDKSFIRILGIIAISILGITLINFVNLTLTSSLERNAEVNIKKILGAHNRHIFIQIISETACISLLAILLGCFMAASALPFFNQTFDIQLHFDMIQPSVLISILGTIWVLISLIAGFIPALYLSKLISSNKGNLVSKSSRSIKYRDALVILQFVIAIVLITGAFLMKKQVNGMISTDPNFDAENVIIAELEGWQIENLDLASQKYKQLYDELEKSPLVKSLCFSHSIPGSIPEHYLSFFPENTDRVEKINFRKAYVGKNYFETFGIKLTGGEVFSKPEGNYQMNLVVNQKAMDILGFEQVDHQILRAGTKNGRIHNLIGAVENYTYQSLEKEIQPIAHIYRSHELSSAWQYLAIRSNKGTSLEAFQLFKSKWSDIIDEYSPNLFFANDQINKHYKEIQRVSKLISLFTILATIFSCIGLFSLSSYSVTKQTKVIGIRKVNGAKTHEIIRTLNKEFLKLVVIAIVIASPLAYYAINKWFQNFAHKTALSWWIFALAGVIALGIALLTVSWQSWRAARRNPVESLRYE